MRRALALLSVCSLATLVACGGAPDAPPAPAPHIERRDALEASANELFEVVASGKVRIHVNQRFALKDAAYARTWGSAAWCPPGRMGRAGRLAPGLS